MSIIPSLPDDISLRILALLPGSSYSRLGLVCRAWRDAFCPNGPIFATRKRLKIVERWIVFLSKIRNGYYEYLLVDPAHRGCLKVVRPPPEPLPLCSHVNTHPIVSGNVILMPEIVELLGGRCFWWKRFNPDIVNFFNVQSMEWTKPDSLLRVNKYSFSGLACATLDGYLYIVGGRKYVDAVQKVAWLDMASKTWEALPKLTKKRRNASVVVLQGCICIIGGFRIGRTVKSGERWDPNSRQWILIPELWPANVFGNRQRGSPCVAVVNDRLYALKWHPLSEVLEELMYYEEASKSWISMGKFSLRGLVESKCAFRGVRVYPSRMVGVADLIFVFCRPDGSLLVTVALYVKPAISEPLTWGVWPLRYPVDIWAEPIITHV